MTWSGTLPTLYAGLMPDGDDFTAITDALHALSDSWTDFSSSVNWTSSGTAPAIGNGTIAARYIQVGKYVVYRGKITMGSTTTYGSANAWQVSLPVTALDAGCIGSAIIFDTSTTANKTPASVGFGPSALNFFTITGPAAQTVPITWATGDILAWAITYEAA